MIILKAIGAFFVKIWRWIKDTAWVQPLLIVGAIFAVIFSIPSITNWANSFTLNSTNSFYNAQKMNLEGETDDKSANSASAADGLANSIAKNTIDNFYVNGTATTFSSDDLHYGSKFFLIFADSTNTASKSAETGFKYLRDNWGQYGYNPTDNGTFKYYTIFKDDTSTTDTDFKDKGSAFERFLSIHVDLFQSTMSKLMDAPYKTRASIGDDFYAKYGFDGSSYDSFPIPAVALVDYSSTAVQAGRAGLSEVLFTISGETDTARASLLLDMWNHTDSDKVATTAVNYNSDAQKNLFTVL
jgi:hypothetical protein